MFYFVECKNLIGNIIVDSNGNFKREYYYGNKKIKEGMYSPLTQAQRHVEIFKKIWAERNTKIMDKLFRRENLDTWNKPLVVMANSKNILDLKYAPKEYKYKIIKSDNLVEYLKKDMAKYDKDLLSNKESMHNMAESLMVNYHKPRKLDYIEKYEKMIVEKDNKKEGDSEEIDIKSKLIAFRKEKSKEKNIPAYYIFTNDELDKMLELIPKTKEELKNANILAEIKFKLYANEIIQIFNK